MKGNVDLQGSDWTTVATAEYDLHLLVLGQNSWCQHSQILLLENVSLPEASQVCCEVAVFTICP